MLEQMKEIISEALGVEKDEVTPEATFKETLGADSLDLVELVMTFEEEFEVEIPTEDLATILTVGDAIKYIESKRS